MSSVEEQKRALDADPENDLLRQRLIQAYVREGRIKEAREFVKGTFRCPLKWDQLDDTEESGIKDCSQCSQQVEFVWSLEDMHEKVQRGQCLAAPQTLFDSYSEDWIQKRLRNPQQQAAACVVESQLAWIENLEDREFDERLIQRWLDGRALLGRFQTLPLYVREKTLYIAVGSPMTQTFLDEIRLAFEIESVEQLLANPLDIQGVLDRYIPTLPGEVFMGSSMRRMPEFFDVDDESEGHFV
jgi:hypothetical protein